MLQGICTTCSLICKLQADENIRRGFPELITLMSWLVQHCSPSTFQINFPGLQPSSIEVWVLQPPALQNQLSQVSFLGIFRAATPPHNFFGGYIFTFRNELVRSQEKKTRAVREFNVCSWIASEFSSCLHCHITMFWTCPAISHFTFLILLEVLYDNWLLLKLLTVL